MLGQFRNGPDAHCRRVMASGINTLSWEGARHVRVHPPLRTDRDGWSRRQLVGDRRPSAFVLDFAPWRHPDGASYRNHVALGEVDRRCLRPEVVLAEEDPPIGSADGPVSPRVAGRGSGRISRTRRRTSNARRPSGDATISCRRRSHCCSQNSSITRTDVSSRIPCGT